MYNLHNIIFSWLLYNNIVKGTFLLAQFYDLMEKRNIMHKTTNVVCHVYYNVYSDDALTTLYYII